MEFLLVKTLFAAAVLCRPICALPSSGGPEVKLSNGDTLLGSICPETLVKKFRGIPYAQPPTGKLRFMPPKEVHGFLNQNGSAFDASNAATPCPQYNTVFTATDPTPSEDW